VNIAAFMLSTAPQAFTLVVKNLKLGNYMISTVRCEYFDLANPCVLGHFKASVWLFARVSHDITSAAAVKRQPHTEQVVIIVQLDLLNFKPVL